MAPKNEKLESVFHELLDFRVIPLLDLLKANPQKCPKTETNTPYTALACA
jgi:hypothetical protein